MIRQVALDTETTGLDVRDGHRILEIGCVEIIGRKLTRRQFQSYLNPERDVDHGAFEVHGISREFLQDKPKFGEIWTSLLEFIEGSEVIIHNASFDSGFLNHELSLLSPSPGQLTDYCTVTDSVELARHKHPGQRNSLDALCKRYGVDNSHRQLHGALLDAEILADVYLLLTGGQVTLGLGDVVKESSAGPLNTRVNADRSALKVIKATEDELRAHEARLDRLDTKCDKGAVWRRQSVGQSVGQSVESPVPNPEPDRQ